MLKPSIPGPSPPPAAAATAEQYVVLWCEVRWVREAVACSTEGALLNAVQGIKGWGREGACDAQDPAAKLFSSNHDVIRSSISVGNSSSDLDSWTLRTWEIFKCKSIISSWEKMTDTWCSLVWSGQSKSQSPSWHTCSRKRVKMVGVHTFGNVSSRRWGHRGTRYLKWMGRKHSDHPTRYCSAAAKMTTLKHPVYPRSCNKTSRIINAVATFCCSMQPSTSNIKVPVSLCCCPPASVSRKFAAN